MSDRLFVAVLGHQNSGKSLTWTDLFNLGKKLKTGKNVRHLALKPNECVEAFLVSGSPEERNKYAGDVLGDQHAKIVLCSIQYVEHCRATLEYVKENNFDLFVQWLNPGHSDNDVISTILAWSTCFWQMALMSQCEAVKFLLKLAFRKFANLYTAGRRIEA